MRWLFFVCMLFALPAAAADTTRLYNPRANAERDVAQRLLQAKRQNKRLLLQVGGNWCLMCYRLNAFLQTDSTLKKKLEEGYIYYHLNYSPENKNEALLKTLDNPQRYGFPVLVVLDADGRRLHTQNMGPMLKGNGYDHQKIKAFLEQWRPPAATLNAQP